MLGYPERHWGLARLFVFLPQIRTPILTKNSTHSLREVVESPIAQAMPWPERAER